MTELAQALLQAGAPLAVVVLAAWVALQHAAASETRKMYEARILAMESAHREQMQRMAETSGEAMKGNTEALRELSRAITAVQLKAARLGHDT